MNFVSLHSSQPDKSVAVIYKMTKLSDYLQNLIQLTFAPSRGWEDLAKMAPPTVAQPQKGDNSQSDTSNLSREESLATNSYYRCFLPFISVCSCSALIRIVYDDGLGFLGAVQQVLITFISLFLAYHIARYGYNVYMPKLVKRGEEYSRGRVMTMTMFCLSFLGLITLISNVIRVRIALLDFLPFYVIFIIWKGSDFLKIDEQRIGLYMILSTLLILGSCFIISFLLNTLT
jgi:hypothetical protein